MHEPFQPPGPVPLQPPGLLPPGDPEAADAVVTAEIPGTEEDIVTLILEDHARIRDLFAELHGEGHQGEDRPPPPAALWTELASLLLTHLHAAEEICYLPFLRSASDLGPSIRELGAHKDDACDAVADARLRAVGSAQWWLAARAARAAADQHADCAESRLLPKARQLPEDTRRMLGRAWRQFMAASPEAEAPG